MYFEDVDFYKERDLRLEVLKMAREMVIEEYAERRTAAHAKWLSDSEKLWHNHRQILPYPVNSAYPNEEVVIERSRILLNFIKD